MALDDTRRFAERWRTASAALEAVRWSELAALDDARSLEFSDVLIEAALRVPLPKSRIESSGLVEQQARFQRLRRP